MLAEEEVVDVAQPPADGVAQVLFGPAGAAQDTLLAASWDAHVHAYDATRGTRVARVPLERPVLAVAWAADGASFVAGGLQRQVVGVDAGRMCATGVLGTHADAVRCLTRCASTGAIFSGGWDGEVAAWDVRASAPRVARTRAPGKVFAADASAGGWRLVVASAGRRVAVYDTRRLDIALQDRESSLRGQTRAVAVVAPRDGLPLGYLAAAVDGRVAFDPLDPAPEQRAHAFAFKCHRERAPPAAGEPEERVYAVNALAVHPRHGTFATGGSDGVVATWDARARKRVRSYARERAGVSSVAFSADGARMALAASYGYDAGPRRDAPADAIRVRAVRESDVLPHARRAPA